MAKAKAKTFEAFGEYRYFKGFPQNRDMDGPDGADWRSHDGMYLTDFIVDEDNMKIIRDSGTELKIRTKADKHCDFLNSDQYLIKFKRQHKHAIADFSGPPVVILGDGTPIDPEEGMGVGNESKGYLQFTVYPTQLRNGTRWEGSQITEWHQYPLASGGANFENRGESKVFEPEDEDDEDNTKENKSEVQSQDIDDEIPL